MSEKTTLHMILHRLHTTPQHVITQAERTDWPASGFQWGIEVKLIQAASPAKTVFCDGCEQDCLMPVMIRPAIHDQPARAIVQCDKPEDMGLVSIEIQALQQWQISLKILAESMGDILKVNRKLIHFDAEKQRWHLGIFNGKKHRRPLFLMVQEEGLALQLAGHSIYLADVMMIANNQLAIDQQCLTRKVDNPCGTDETPKQRQTRIEKRIAELKAQDQRSFLKIVAAEEGVSVSMIKQIISRGKPKKKKKSYDGLPTSLSDDDF
ncbi:MAG: hypothetical protein GY782_05630 [Gammaproteobacteria bacterium]|nr:hypothetical protein [Gammaproteobacteria bacterium]